MPANLTPQYHEAEKEFKEAKTIEEKIACMEKMLALIPKHKGTDHMQADLKHKLSKLKKEQLEGKGKGKQVAVYKVEKEGAGQIVLLGAPNTGKSKLLSVLTNANAVVAEYPFTTHAPQPGMVKFEDIQIQLVDTPPITPDYLESWLPDIVRRGDAIVLVADLGDDNLLDSIEFIINRFEAMKVDFVKDIPPDADTQARLYKRAAILANKSDCPGAQERLDILREYYGNRYDIWPVSAEMGNGMDVAPRLLFDFLRVIRVYTKEPGKKADLQKPYTLPVGTTVLEMAVSVHREFEQLLKSARVWGSGKYDGIAVKRDHVLQDGDIVELHI